MAQRFLLSTLTNNTKNLESNTYKSCLSMSTIRSTVLLSLTVLLTVDNSSGPKTN